MSLTNCLAIDVECVGRQDGKSMAARVSIVNEYFKTVMDTYVCPTHPVADYRTFVSGIRKHNLNNAPDFWEVREDVRRMIKGRVLVGHALHHDLNALRLCHPDWKKRDTSYFPIFVQMNRNRTPSLRWLARVILNKNIQVGEHNSVQDASAAMQLYDAYKEEWEEWIYEECLDSSSSDDSAPSYRYRYSSSSSDD